jgi:hypothetical protein
MLLRVYLPLGVLVLAVVMWLLQMKLVLAPIIMLLVWPYWLAMAVGIGLTAWRNFVIGGVAAALITVALLLLLDTGNADIGSMGIALFAPWIPLAIVQLIAAPFQLRKAEVVG